MSVKVNGIQYWRLYADIRIDVAPFSELRWEVGDEPSQALEIHDYLDALEEILSIVSEEAVEPFQCPQPCC